MKVIKIIKTVNTPIHHYMFYDDSVSDETITYDAEEWCINDPNGQSRGYSWKWVEVVDKTELAEILSKEIKLIGNNIERLNHKRENLTSFYNEVSNV